MKGRKLHAASRGSARRGPHVGARRRHRGSEEDVKAAPAPFKVALVTDIGGLDDRSFNPREQGLQQAKTKLGVQGRVFISKTGADYVPNLSTAARQGYNLIISVGFLMGESTAAVAKRFPKQKFAIIDFSAPRKTSRAIRRTSGPALQGAGGRLSGRLPRRAPVEERPEQRGVIAAVGGQKIPPVDRFIGGYYQGAKKAYLAVKVEHSYPQDFVNDTAKCKELALNHIANGATVVFQVAGQCGLGALSAAKEKNVFGIIGVDADQWYLGNHILTSATKKVDVAVYDTISVAKSTGAKFRTGFSAIYTVKNGGVGYGRLSTRGPASWRRALLGVRAQIATGKIKVTQTAPPPVSGQLLVCRSGAGFRTPPPSGTVSA